MAPPTVAKKRKLRLGQAREKYNSRMLLLLMRDHGIPVETIIREYGYSRISKQNRVFEFIINQFLVSGTRVLPYSKIPYKRCVMTATMTSTMRTGGLSKLLDSFYSLSPILIHDKEAETVTLHGDVLRDLTVGEAGYWSHPDIAVDRKGSSDEETDEDELIQLLKAPREDVSSESEDEEMETCQSSSPRTQTSVMSQTESVTSQTTAVSMPPSRTSSADIVTSQFPMPPPLAAGTSRLTGVTSLTTSSTSPSTTMTLPSTQVTSHPTAVTPAVVAVTPAVVAVTSQCQQVTCPSAAMTSQSQVTSEAQEARKKTRKEKQALRLAAEAAHREVVNDSRKLNLAKVRHLLAQFNFSPDVMVASVGHAAFTNLLRLYEVIISLLLQTNCGKMKGLQLRKRALQINQSMSHSAPQNRLSLSNLEQKYPDMAPIVKYYASSDDVIVHQKVYREWMVDVTGEWVPRTVESEPVIPTLDFGKEPGPSSGPSTSETNDSGPVNSGPASKPGTEPSWQDQSAMQEYCGLPECNKRQKFNTFILMEVMESVYDYSLSSMIARYGLAGMRKQLSLYEHIINSLLRSKYGALNHHLMLQFYDKQQASKMNGHKALLMKPEECYSKLGSILYYRKDKGTVRLDDKFRKTVELKKDGFWNVIGDSKEELEAKIQNRKYAENVAEGYTPNLLQPVRKVRDNWCPFEEENMARIRDMEEAENLQRRLSGLLPAKRIKLPDPQNCKSTMAVLSPPYRRVDKRSVSTNCTSDDIPKIPIIFRCWNCHQIPNEDVILDAVCGKLVGCRSCFSRQEPKYCPHCINIGKFVVLKGLHRKLWEMRHDDTGEV